jgi:hypothetical protein
MEGVSLSCRSSFVCRLQTLEEEMRREVIRDAQDEISRSRTAFLRFNSLTLTRSEQSRQAHRSSRTPLFHSRLSHLPSRNFLLAFTHLGSPRLLLSQRWLTTGGSLLSLNNTNNNPLLLLSPSLPLLQLKPHHRLNRSDREHSLRARSLSSESTPSPWTDT